MTANPAATVVPAPQKPVTSSFVLLAPKETAGRLKVSTSWLAKARMRGDGPPFIKLGRAIRYSEAALIQWMKGQQRLSTSE
jgi:predicted DNA-binding transcriptional regulator AlpA